VPEEYFARHAGIPTPDSLLRRQDAVVTGSKDVFIFDSHRAHMMPQAVLRSATTRSYFQEIFISADSLAGILFMLTCNILCLAFSSCKWTHS